MTRSSFILLLLLLPMVLQGQETSYLEFVKVETRLASLFDRLYTDSLAGTDSLLDSLQT